MVVTPSGISMPVSAVQPLKILAPVVFRLRAQTTLLRLEQLSKAAPSSVARLLGSVTASRPVQPRKASVSIIVSVLGRRRSVRAVQFRNA